MVQFNVLLTRTQAKAHSLVGLPRNGTEPRGAIVADLDAGGRTLKVAVTHLALSLSGRKRQLTKLLEVTLEQTETPFALLADLNTMFAWEGACRLLNRSFPDQRNVASFPARFPLLALDTIRVRPAEAIRSFAAFGEGDARHASDHLPLIADIALP
jgi:endonuclease/exonuclease/phosphatase family metal-dependent hydrolase